MNPGNLELLLSYFYFYGRLQALDSNRLKITKYTPEETDLYKPLGFFLNPFCVLYDCICVT